MVTRYEDGGKYCKKCNEYVSPDNYYLSPKGLGYFHKECGGRVRSAPRHRHDRVKYLTHTVRI